MEALLKRYFWVINLSLLSGIAWGSADLVSQLLAIEIRALPIEKKAATVTVSPTRSATVKRQQWATPINQRNLFNSDPPSPEEASKAGESEEEGPAPGELPGINDPCDAAGGGLRLEALMVFEPIEASLLTIATGQGSAIYRIGDEIEGYQIAALQRSGLTKRRVVLFKDGQFSCIGGDQQKRPRPKARSTAPRKQANQPKRAGRNNRYSDMVTKVGAGQYEVNRERLNAELEDMDKLLRQARAVPHRQNGKTVGFKVVGIRSNSLFRSLGLRSGDVLTSVNGESLDSINKAFGLFEQLKSSDQLTLGLKRRGQDQNFDYSIR